MSEAKQEEPQIRCSYCGKKFFSPEDARPVNHNCKDYILTPSA